VQSSAEVPHTEKIYLTQRNRDKGAISHSEELYLTQRNRVKGDFPHAEVYISHRGTEVKEFFL
jgi:hypothetical protein